jgi:pSer/pThr/pTyr-binding forkhead associated (FHA) protein
MRGTPPLHTSTPAELQARIAAERAGMPFLEYRDGGGVQRIVALGEVVHLTVGRDPANDVALDWDANASRLHSELALLGGQWTIADDGLSRNGTFVNGTRISGRRLLRDGDIVRIGSTDVAFRAPAAEPLAETQLPVDAHLAPLLTPAQRRVLVALARPFAGDSYAAVPASNREIADELVVSIDAVKANLRALFERLGVEDLPQNRKRARLVELAFSSGVISRRDLG